MTEETIILDGGMGRELQRIGAPFRQPEWSALALIESPDHVRQAHESFARAGADMLTSNSYAVVPFHIGRDRFDAQGLALADRAGRLARSVADAHGVKAAGSLPPVFGSYRPDLFLPEQVDAILRVLVDGLAPHVDVWLAETQSALDEARAVRRVLGDDARPLWLSFTLDDTDAGAVAAGRSAPALRSGESVADAARTAAGLGARALLFNCSQPEVMRAAVETARAQPEAAALRIGVYANAFPPQPKTAEANDGLDPIRDDLDPASYLRWAESWVEAGASIVGGCCGIGPDHIAALAGRLTPGGTRIG
ncbi:betaine-homocysteine S-methyltransferase (plasmid) [Azospirillum sp. B510]|uniref:homocysteine S-methyltransferase family protein n=1 Tax=Azospirillum sp. (strain B510) TaxID=137722 RepID=UPI0001C4CBAD|nr:homocysteine S-methyltransferase family protein [Azospirillum sp. B510]BAI75358.1 betaine-homocysteine S-methyltransferase [Azospirillum sp. B510]